MNWLKSLFSSGSNVSKTKQANATANTKRADPASKSQLATTKAPNAEYHVPYENRNYAHLYSRYGLLKRIDDLEVIANASESPIDSAAEDLKKIVAEKLHVAEMQNKINAFGDIRLELKKVGDILSVNIDYLIPHISRMHQDDVFNLLPWLEKQKDTIDFNMALLGHLEISETKKRFLETELEEFRSSLSKALTHLSFRLKELEHQFLEQKNKNDSEETQSIYSGFVERYHDEFEFIIRNMTGFDADDINYLNLYLFTAHPLTPKAEKDLLADTSYNVILSEDDIEDQRNRNAAIYVDGPNFSDDENCKHALAIISYILANTISNNVKYDTPITSNEDWADCCIRLSNLGYALFSGAFTSPELRVRERIQAEIIEAYTSETQHLCERLEEKKAFIKSRFQKSMRSTYDEFGELQPLNVHDEVQEILSGIKIERGYGRDFIIFSEPRDDFVEIAIHYMKNWLDNDEVEQAPVDGFEFEKWLADQLNQNGWTAYATRGSGDQGVDVVAECDGVTVGIQCKRYSSKVGNKAVQEIFSGVQHMGLDKAVVVTNAGYTKSARDLAASTGVLLSDPDAIPELKALLRISMS